MHIYQDRGVLQDQVQEDHKFNLDVAQRKISEIAFNRMLQTNPDYREADKAYLEGNGAHIYYPSLHELWKLNLVRNVHSPGVKLPLALKVPQSEYMDGIFRLESLEYRILQGLHSETGFLSAVITHWAWMLDQPGGGQTPPPLWVRNRNWMDEYRESVSLPD